MYARSCCGGGGALGLSVVGPSLGFDLDTSNGGGGGGGWSGWGWPDPIRTDTDPNVPPATNGGGAAPGPEVAAPGAGEEMLGWILGAFLSAALISREG